MSRRLVPERVSRRSIFALAKKLYNEARDPRNCRRGFALLKQAADLGVAEAHGWLGFVYHCGFGTRSNRRLAFRHYKIAAEAGQPTDPTDEYHLGFFYHEGIGVRRDRRLGLLWIRRAARHGSATATYWLGLRRLVSGAPGSKRRGFELVLEAAKRGEPLAQHAVGICYERGEGVAADPKSAFQWYLRAAKRNSPHMAYAAEALGRLYETGRGVRMSKRKAAFWYDRASRQPRRPKSGSAA